LLVYRALDRCRGRPGEAVKRHIRLALWLTWGLAGSTSLVGAQSDQGTKAVIRNLDVGRQAEGFQVSFRVSSAFSEDLLERVHSGIPLTFRHRVELLGRRVVPLFPRKTLGRTLVLTTVSYDSLTRRYDLERRTTGKIWPREKTPPDRVEHQNTSSPEEMEAWMTVLNEVPLPGFSSPKGVRLRVRVRSELGRRFVLLLFPSTTSATQEQILEY